MMKMSSEIIDGIGKNVDRLVTVDFSGRGVISRLHEALTQRQKKPGALLAAERLLEAVKPDDFVIITAGMLINPWYELGETDGPVGAAALARALQVGLGAKPVLVTDKAQVDLMKAACRGANLNFLSLERVKETKLSAAVIDFPMDQDNAMEEAKGVFSDISPKAIIAIERRGPNEKGVYHSLLGYDMTRFDAKVGVLFEEAERRRLLTIGIGDGGNEIGLAMIKDSVKQIIPTAVKCRCPCEASVVPNIFTDLTIVATVSNWGAYAISACLSAILKKPDVLHDKNIELRIVRACVDAGAIDGVFYTPTPYVDGMPAELGASIVEQLREIVKGGLQGPLLARKDYVAYARSLA